MRGEVARGEGEGEKGSKGVRQRQGRVREQTGARGSE